MATREVTRPINKLIATGQVRKTGVKSSTRYYPTEPNAAASAERRPGGNSSTSAGR
jgi:hypothetical protein